jgi:hypothetical protein
VVARYTYRDANTAAYLQVQRTASKQFLQYHWTGNTWRPGKPKGPKIPYRLPELIKASPKTTIYFCEGEKCADAMAACDFTATTASEGAQAAWDDAMTPYFKDRHVAILVDADKPGRSHGEKVAKALDAVAASVRVVDLYPERIDGSDVADWLKEDPSGARLVRHTLCRLATGGGFATRQLFTDDAEMLFDAMRPIVLNGIEDVVVRPDLVDRSIMLTLPSLDDKNRRPEKELWDDFARDPPGILGVLLDAVTVGLGNCEPGESRATSADGRLLQVDNRLRESVVACRHVLQRIRGQPRDRDQRDHRGRSRRHHGERLNGWT